MSGVQFLPIRWFSKHDAIYGALTTIIAHWTTSSLKIRSNVHNMWYSVGKGPIWSFLEMEILRKIGKIAKKSKKNYFLYFGVLRHQKHSYVGRILKKSLLG